MRSSAFALACLALVLAGCGAESTQQRRPAERSDQAAAATSKPRTVQDVQAALPRLARDVIPDSALRSIAPGELKVEECGISPTFPCTNVYFAVPGKRGLESQLRLLRVLGQREGWRLERIKRFQSGAYLDLVRAQFHARYTLGEGLTRPGESFAQLAVYGPATALPQPTVVEQTGWSDEKRRYVREANVLCVRTLGPLTSPDQVAPTFALLAKKLAALDPPPGEEEEVRTFVRPLQTLARSARALTDEKGEDVLPAVVGVGEFTKRFIEAASRYGLDRCVLG
jgi:hypothetical protein